MFGLKHNGPAVCFSKRNPTEAPGRSWFFRQKLSRCKLACRQAGRVWHVFLQPCCEVSCLYVYRGTMCLGAGYLSRCRNVIEITSGKRPMSERSGDWGARLRPVVGVILAAGSEAKNMTSLLNIPTVLALAYFSFKKSLYFC